jgi:hypothetical protein
MAGIATFERMLWGVSVALKWGLLVLFVFRKNYRTFPLFFTYVLVTAVQSPVLFVSYRTWGFQSVASGNIAWGTQGLVIAARGLAVAEICRRILGVYRGIWALASRLLLATAGLVLEYSWAVARPHWQAAVLNCDRGLELAIAAVLMMVFLFASHYEIEVEQTVRYLALGLFLYSCLSVVNNTVLEKFSWSYAPAWNLFRTVAFVASLLLWAWALRERQPETVSEPTMLPEGSYRALTPELNLRLKALNDQLGTFWYAEAKKH